MIKVRDRIFQEIEREIAKRKGQLDSLRQQFDVCDANDSHTQVRVMQDITNLTLQLQAIESLHAGLLKNLG